MSAKWQLGTVDIYVSEEDISREIKRAELFVLDATTSTFHFFGAGSQKRSLKGLVIGETAKNELITYAISDTSLAFVTPWQTWATGWRINGIPKFSPLKYSGGTVDGVSYSAETTAIYNAELELIYDV